MRPSEPDLGARRPPAPTEEERALFRATLKDAQPLKKAKPANSGVGAGLRPAPTISPEKAEPNCGVRSAPPPALPPRKPAPNPGLDRRTAERLRKGEIPIERRIDLHGMTQENAHAALDRFVRAAWSEGRRMLLVITGKGSIGSGGGVLRQGVPRWLGAGEHASRVLKITPAQPRHGGSGAYYVLLRRRRDEEP